MMKTRGYVILILAISLLTVACEKALLDKDPENDPETNFDYLWNELNNKYAYFELKGIDWLEIYDEYRPLVSPDMTDYELFDLLGDMLFELEDGHVNLRSPFDRSRNWTWYLDYPQNYNETVVSRNYLGDDHRITGPLRNQLIDSVLYVRYESFGNTIEQEHLDYLLERAEGTRGIILDIRNNGGGSLGNAKKLASVFTGEGVRYGMTRIKTGPGEDDFSPWKTLSFNPGGGATYEGQVILLCNRLSYSASNTFALMMKALPQVTLMGDSTGGGGGIPAYGELPNGWIFRYSASQTVDLSGEHIEDGVPVDVPVSLDPAAEALGIDSIIEEALVFFDEVSRTGSLAEIKN